MYVGRNSEIPSLEVNGREIGGVKIEGDASLKVLKSGDDIQIVELKIKKGYFHPLHVHPEHESIGYLISGLMEMVIGGEVVRLGPGDAWHHPRGVHHSTRAIEDTFAIEIHTPLRQEYTMKY